MSPRLLCRVLATVVLIAALALPLSAQAAPVPRPSTGVAGPALLEDLTETFRHWLAHFLSRTFEKNGAMVDPNGTTTPAGTSNGGTTPAGRSDNGPIIDPNG
jgi:hypothetical protein